MPSRYSVHDIGYVAAICFIVLLLFARCTALDIAVIMAAGGYEEISDVPQLTGVR
jgi:hypothetical protein